MSVLEAVERDLDKIRELDSGLADSALAALAKSMAAEIDNQRNSATSKSMCAARLQDALGRLRELTPAAEEEDELDQLAQRRQARRSGGAAAAH